MEKVPAYQVIQKEILLQISDGTLVAGMQLPTEAQLMQQYDVSRITVQRALSELKQMGVVVRKRHAGTFVSTDIKLNSILQSGSNKLTNKTIGVVAPFDMQKDNSYSYLNGIMRSVSHANLGVSLHNTRYNQEMDSEMLSNCILNGNSGIIYYPGLDSAPPIELLIRIAAENYPCVLIDKYFPEVNLPCFQCDNVHAARQMTAHLIERKHRKILFFSYEKSQPIYERYAGYCNELSARGMEILPMCFRSKSELSESVTAPENLVREIIDQGVTAVFCATDLMAMILRNVCSNLGIDVPGQLAIAGFDGVYPGTITSMLQPYDQIGRMAANTLQDWMNTYQAERTRTMLQVTLIQGQTT